MPGARDLPQRSCFKCHARDFRLEENRQVLGSKGSKEIDYITRYIRTNTTNELHSEMSQLNRLEQQHRIGTT